MKTKKQTKKKAGKKVINKKICPKAVLFTQEILSLPCRPGMTMQQVDYVCKMIKRFYEN